MKDKNNSRKGRLFFCYADPVGFSGQKAAAEIVLNGLTQRGWRCGRLPQPVLDRAGGRWSRLRYSVGLGRSWVRALQLLGSRDNQLWVGLGQSLASFVRDAVPLLLAWLRLGRANIVISLNGSVFMLWPDNSVEIRIFRFLLRLAGTVTVVGNRQRARLIALGLPATEVHVVVNSCDVELAPCSLVEAKHSPSSSSQRAMRCLFLSSLVDTKGYPEYLEALDRLATVSGMHIEAVLCGRLAVSEFAERFATNEDAENWIEAEMDLINRRRRQVQVRWVKGATGEAKAALFQSADVFVLPTHYAVEAQPLVLLEAMASGCAIITTKAGEISTVLDEDSACFLSTVSAETVAAALQSLLSNSARRRRLALNAYQRYRDRYQVARHLEHWEKLLQPSRSRVSSSRLIVENNT